MSTDELAGFLRQDEAARAALSAFMESVEAAGPDDGTGLDEALDRNLREAMTAYDPHAVLPRTLALRLHGEGLQGRLPDDALTDILVPFRRELAGAAAAGSQAETLKLDLVGYSRGSSVLHLAPAPAADVEPPDEQDPPSLAAGPDHIDNALAVVTDLHTAAETGSDLLRFARQPDLVRGFAALADALDKHQLDLDIHWRAGTGAHRDSTLTSRGRQHARTYLERTEQTLDLVLTGRIVSLAINGTFGLKPSLRAAVVEVHTEGEQALLDLRLQLGQTAVVRIRRHETNDRLGTGGTTRHDLIAVDSVQDDLG